MGRLKTLDRDERGSLAPLTIGYVALALLAAFIVFSATDLYIAQKHLDQVADAAALAAADGFAIDPAGTGSTIVGQTEANVLAEEIVALSGAATTPTANPAWLVSVSASNDVASVQVASTWHPPMLGGLLPSVELMAEASAATRLR